MGITLTQTGDTIFNYPPDEPSGLTPNDIIVTAASPTILSAEFSVGELTLVVIAEGQFSYQSDVVGLSYGEASFLTTGTVNKETATVTRGDAVTSVEITTYSTPKAVEPVTTFDRSLADLQTEYAGDDIFIGDREVPGSDSVHGYGGNDRFVMTYSEEYTEKFRGGEGIDTAVIESESMHWNISTTDSAWDSFTQQSILDGYYVADTRYRDTGAYGENGHVLQLVEVERIEFTDVNLALDLNGSAGQTVKTLAAVLGSDSLSNKQYVGVGLQLFDAGQSLETVCGLALQAAGATTNEQVVNTLYSNLYGEAPTAELAQPFVDALNAGAYSQGFLAAAAAELTDDLGVIDLVGLAETGIEYV
jgi:hypothetical protein